MSAPPTSTAISLGGASSHRSWRSWQAGAPPTACRTAASHRRPRRFRRAAHEEMAQNRGGCPPVSVLQGRRRRAGSSGTRPATGNRPTGPSGAMNNHQRTGASELAHAPFPVRRPKSHEFALHR